MRRGGYVSGDGALRVLCEVREAKIMGHCKVIEDMLDEVRYNAKSEMALNMLIITNLSLADIAEVTELTVDEVRKISKDANKVYI